MKIKRKYYGIVILLLLVVIGIGYAALTTTLNITGTSSINKNTWDVHFENVKVTSGSVKAIKDATIDSNTTNLSYEIKLTKPGDFYEFTVDIKNVGSIDAMISDIVKLGLTPEQANYLSYTLCYSDSEEIRAKDKLVSGETKSIIVRLEFKNDITAEQLPDIDQNLSLSLNITYIQADDTANTVSASFATDSWDKIVRNVKSGRIDTYHLGDTKEVDMGEFGTHTVRIANTTTPTECSTDGFSQTACGFVVEFSDIITTHVMNSTPTNIGGWPASEMRTYIQNTIYSAIPTELRSRIIDTIVVSGHGSDDAENFISTDKLYLLSTKEIWGKDGINSIVIEDTAEVETRQLDYYKSKGVMTDNYSNVIKKKLELNYSWRLRSATSRTNYSFFFVRSNGIWSNATAEYDVDFNGVSPSFRIG